MYHHTPVIRMCISSEFFLIFFPNAGVGDLWFLECIFSAAAAAKCNSLKGILASQNTLLALDLAHFKILLTCIFHWAILASQSSRLSTISRASAKCILFR